MNVTRSIRIDENTDVSSFLNLLKNTESLNGDPVLVLSTLKESKLGKLLVTGSLNHKVIGIALNQGVKTLITINDHSLFSEGENLRREMRLIRTTIKLDLQVLTFNLLQETLLQHFFKSVVGATSSLLHINREYNIASIYFQEKISLQSFFSIPAIHSNLLFSYRSNNLISKIILIPDVISKNQLETIIEQNDHLEETGFLLCTMHDLILQPLRREKIPSLGLSYYWLKDQIARALGLIIQRKSNIQINYALDTHRPLQTPHIANERNHDS